MSIGVVNQGVGKRLDQQLFSPYNMQHIVKWIGDENDKHHQLAIDIQGSIVTIQSLEVYLEIWKTSALRKRFTSIIVVTALKKVENCLKLWQVKVI